MLRQLLSLLGLTAVSFFGIKGQVLAATTESLTCTPPTHSQLRTQTLTITLRYATGPGCSSLEGAFAEQGQLLVNSKDTSTLVLNPYAWTNVSNMLFLEAPTCVGYSYGDQISDCSHNDSSQAADNYLAMLTFFEGFPEYASNDFFISGESYAGIYV